METSTILRFQRILELAREEGMMSLARLGVGASSVNSECSKEVGDRGITTLSEASLFQQSRERRLVVRMIEAALARIQQGAFGVWAAAATKSIHVGSTLCPGMNTIFAAKRPLNREKK